MKKWLALMGMAILIAVPLRVWAGGIQLHQQPINLRQSEKVQVFVEDVALTVTDVQVNHRRKWVSRPMIADTPMALFSMEQEPVAITLVYPGEVQKAIVRPLNANVNAVCHGNTVSFVLNTPMAYTIEINDDTASALHLFASPMETDVPDQADENVLYFGPGVHNAGVVNLQSGQTLYLAGGAVLRGAVHAAQAENITIKGRGIIDGVNYDRWNDTVVPLDFVDCKNVRIEGVTLINAAAWNLNTYRCENVSIEWVNIVAACSNSDGITTQSCRDLKVRHCFVRSWDDSLVVKGYDGDVKGILFEDCIVWTDLAQSMEIGYECRADVMEDIVFRNITVLHNFHKPVMSIHNSDNARVKDVLFQNIVVEDAQMGQGDGAPLLIELTTTKSQWSKAKERGQIRNVVFDNIKVLSGIEPSWRIFAFSKEYTIDDVLFRNIEVLGKKITSFEQIKYSKNNKLGSHIGFEDDNVTVSQNKRGVIKHYQQQAAIPKGNAVFSASASSHTQSYEAANAVDGNFASYWEGANMVDALEIVSDAVFDMNAVVIALNPDRVWQAREQTISVEAIDTDGNVLARLEEMPLVFDPDTDNRVRLELEATAVARLRITFAGNTGSIGGQAAEIWVE